jgi:gamma-glutamylcyclotransferase (GGCT)/AIG2-like uncharacterized protein YtfP
MKKKPRTLYFAYGANTNHEAMKLRCPEAIPYRPITLSGYKLAFRGVADVIPQEDSKVAGMLWWITKSCEKRLDRFEGFPNLYVKEYGVLTIDGKREFVMFYVMNDASHFSPPYPSYEECLREGYKQSHLPAEQLDIAIDECYPRNLHHFNF